MTETSNLTTFPLERSQSAGRTGENELKRLIVIVMLAASALVGVSAPANAYPSCSRNFGTGTNSAGLLVETGWVICSGSGSYHYKATVKCEPYLWGDYVYKYGASVGKNTVSTAKCPVGYDATWVNAILTWY